LAAIEIEMALGWLLLLLVNRCGNGSKSNDSFPINMMSLHLDDAAVQFCHANCSTPRRKSSEFCQSFREINGTLIQCSDD